MIRLESINQDNFNEFLSLLKNRGEAPYEFYKWKYIDNIKDNFEVGFLAKKNDSFIGCIGLVNYRLCFSEYSCNVSWFADWFVLNEFRKFGIGKKLMEKVSQYSEIGFGLPGPFKAQIISEKVGYKKLHYFYELQLPINPTNVAMKKFSSYPRKFFKFIQLNYQFFKYIKFNSKSCYEISNLDINLWSKLSRDKLKNKNYFERSIDRLFHFIKMPSDPDKNRSYWCFSDNCYYIVGFTETDFWGLKIAKILDLFCSENEYENIFLKLVISLKNDRVDIIKIILSAEKIKILNLSNNWFNLIPIHQISNNNQNINYLSYLDVESSWRAFKMNS